MLKETLNYEEYNETSIELNKIFNFFIRQKKIIGAFSIIGLVMGIFNASLQKKIWQGDFQIVLEQDNQLSQGLSSELSGGSLLNSLNLGGSAMSQLRTEIGILKSPSVLFDIFEFVKAEKSLNDKSFSNIRFTSWTKNSLKVDLEKGTKILNLKYFDTDKEIILPVLNKISEKYQNYSLNKRNRNLLQGLDYFSNQIKKYKEKSNISFKKAQSFGLKNDINIVSTPASENNFYPITDAENFQSNANLELKSINSKISIVESLNDDDEIINIAESILGFNGDIESIKKINSKLAILENIYRDSDKRIINLKNQKRYMAKLLKKSVMDSLKIEKDINLSRLEDAKRSEKNIIEYKLLFSNSQRDLATLNELNNNYRILMLERARKKSPWELITKPTLLPNPVGPSRSKTSALGLIMGFFIGSTLSFFKEKKADLIYDAKDFKTKSGLPILSSISFSNDDYFTDAIDIFIANYLRNLKGSKALLILGEINKRYFNLIEKQLKNNFSNGEFIITKDIKETSMSDNIILIAFLGSIKNKDLTQSTNMLQFNEKANKGVLLFNEKA